MRMRLINLDRSTDRLALFKARNPNFGTIDRVSAVDGRSADRERLIQNEVMSPDLVYSDGALGCALSHLTQWRDCFQSGDVLTIVEDDAVLCGNFREEASRIIASLPDDWEYIAWGYNFDAPLTYDLGVGLSPCFTQFDQNTLRRSIGEFAAKDQEAFAFRLLACFGTVCYSISPRGAAKLLEFCLPLRPMSNYNVALGRTFSNKGIDNMLGNAWPSMAAYVTVPPLAITENDKSCSTIPVRPTLAPSGFDTLQVEAIEQIFVGVGVTDEMAVGFRDGDQALCTERLRRFGWAGFDLAVHPTMLARALRARDVPTQFDLLHTGISPLSFHALRAALADFAPRVVIAAVNTELGDEDLVSPVEWTQAQADLPRGASRLALSRLATRFGYVMHTRPGMDDHAVLLRQDVHEGADPLFLQEFPVFAAPSDGELSQKSANRTPGYLTSEHYLLDGVAVASTAYAKMAYFENDEFIGRTYANGGFWDEETVSRIAKLIANRSEFVLDIGAHIGSHSIFLARSNVNLRFCCFEPQRSLFLLLERNIYENGLSDRIEAVWSAVGHKSGTFAMSDKVNEDGKTQDVQYGVEAKVNFGGVQLGLGGRPCPIVRIDDLTLPPLCYIKLDVEGAETLALAGLTETLHASWPLVFFEDREDRRLSAETLEALAVPEGLRGLGPSDLLKSIDYQIEPFGGDFLAIPSRGTLFQSSGITRRIFQTWKTRKDLPQNFALWSATYRRLNPTYDYVLSDDAGNRAFMEANFAWFLQIYDSYPQEIMRADVVRYFQLFLYGGFYADMDAECLRPLDHLLEAGDVVLGRMGSDPLHPHCIPNAMMASRPRQEFWLLVIWLLNETVGSSASVEARTGPVLLKSAVDLWNANDPIFVPHAVATVRSCLKPEQRNTEKTRRLTILPPHRWYGLDWTDPVHQLLRQQILQGGLLEETTKTALFGDADMVTYWSHTW